MTRDKMNSSQFIAKKRESTKKCANCIAEIEAGCRNSRTKVLEAHTKRQDTEHSVTLDCFAINVLWVFFGGGGIDLLYLK